MSAISESGRHRRKRHVQAFSELAACLKRQSRCSLGDRFVPHIVPPDDFSCEESWSEWQDLNLRPPRPERVSLRESSMFSDKSNNVQRALFAFGFIISVGNLSG
jgi:hypothetical protein